MYEAFYGFKQEPFRLSPDSDMCFAHASYKKARSYMQYALQRREGFVMVTGRPGTGKSTLVADMAAELVSQGHVFASLTCTQVEADDLLRLVVLKFGLRAPDDSKANLINDLESYFLRLHREGRRPVLIIDEAQDLPASALEELRLLTNMQVDNQPLLQIFLVGQEELRATVTQPGLEQLHQRIVAACHLRPLEVEATEAYIKHRLERVGWQGDPALEDAIFPLIHEFSLGIPRLINQVCSRLLLQGMVEEKHQLGVADVESVLEDLGEEQLRIPARESQVRLV
jgi:putative secretion ATPase (PEP-CTERM system associated)